VVVVVVVVVVAAGCGHSTPELDLTTRQTRATTLSPERARATLRTSLETRAT
jgi:hypothetical protein